MATLERAEPVAEMISKQHSWPVIANWLSKFEITIRESQSRYIMPIMIEIDFSWALLIVVNKAFNNCEVVDYLNRSYTYIRKNNLFPKGRTIIHLCEAHIIHAASRRLNKVGRPFSDELKGVAVLQNSQSLGDAENAYPTCFLFSCGNRAMPAHRKHFQNSRGCQR